MKNKKNVLYSVLFMLAGVVNFPLQSQQKKGTSHSVEIKDMSTSRGPNGIVRTIKQDRKGSIWITSWEGVFKYDGKSFSNVTSKVSSARFFSVLEDKKGNFWFASIGSGVYYYDGKSFQNFTTKDGLANDRVTTIYEDKSGIIWFGTESGISRFDGKSFRNLKINEAPPVTKGDSVHVSVYQNPLPENHWIHNDINAVIEDKTGRYWLGTRGNATIYDGKTFTAITKKDGKPFTNVRSIIKDKKGNIWLGGNDGLWRYDGKTFTNFTRKFVGYIYEDKKGNIWTSSEGESSQSWVLSLYDGKSLSAKKPTVTRIANKPMIFGILEDDKGNIWFGALDGVYRYNGKTITDFKGGTAGQK
ncbi:ligand-binding sensor domain-containing protein [Flavobacterium aquicola]|uniref:Two component regulator with propeller domain n=1 Tax=Flavobacterium aquicola TaxID=1682742 RepID=A0A3E0EJC3_9FLAO|nr:two-component regulator propeller domain-containing protein [Flavobacterium aquicola]REG97843.1 two component regulator with propeller domain [Flavobacterium aquicola]